MLIYPAQVVAPFIAPALAWAGVAMVSVPVAIHLLSRWRRRPEPWGAMRFLLEAYRKQKRRMRLEQWLLLLLRCLIVLLLGLALARPLLVGFLGSWLGGLNNQGRLVNLVIDDAMSLRADDSPNTTRFDRLIESANAVIDTLEPGDRATLWRAGRPAGPVIAEPTLDHASLRQALAQMRPGYSRSDQPGVLRRIAEAAQDRQATSTQSVTFLFSDFIRSTQHDMEASDAVPDGIADSSTLVVTRPLPAFSNVQVSSVIPRRRVVWVGGLTDSSITIEARVARLLDDLPEATVGLTIELIDVHGRTLTSTQRQIVFVNGQSEVTLGVDLPVGASPSWLESQGGTLLTLRAKLDAETDGLRADNQAYAVVELRRRMRVAVVDEPAGLLIGQDTGLTPGQWVTLALNPQAVGTTGMMEVVPLTPSELNDPDVLNGIDAVMLMRPDRMIRPMWQELSSFTNDGGLVWVFTPAEEGSSPWVSLMVEAFDPGWRIGLESVQTSDLTASFSLAGSPLLAEPLERLAADWQVLTRPLRVYRYLPLNAGGSDAWITLAQSQAVPSDNKTGSDRGSVLLAHRRVGLGSLLMLSTAVDTRWTNLPTKPLFVPMIHETLHGVLGSRDRPGVVRAVSGDQPALGPVWSGVTALERLKASNDLVMVGQDEGVDPIRPGLKVDASGVALDGPVSLPGVYLANTDDGPRRLVIDPDPKAGDSRQINEEALTHWLDGMGAWRWFDEDDPGSALARSGDSADIGWALLWVVLALVLVESVAARFMSHADAGRSASLSTQLWRTVIRLRSGNKTDSKSGRAA